MTAFRPLLFFLSVCFWLVLGHPALAAGAPRPAPGTAPGTALAAQPAAQPAAQAAADAQSASGAIEFVDENAGEQRWNLTADTLTSLGDGAVLEATGNVFMRRGLDYLKADYARYYPSTNWVYLRGAVDVRMGKDAIRAKEAEFDLRSRTGWLTDGDIFMEGPHMYFKGGRIIKHRGDRYTFQQAKITACDGDVPAWSVLADEAIVEIDGYARLYRSTFQVADTAVLASPFMIVPAKTQRQSGFLVPDYGISSERGFFYTQPYFQVIDESRDMTYYATMMTRMGFMGSARYRSQTTAYDKTWFMVSGNAAKQIDSLNRDWRTDSSLSRTNWDRYWLRGMADGYVGESPWRYRMDLDYVSDQKFLQQFSDGPVGFDQSRRELFNTFGRDLREDTYKRQSAGIIFRDWERVGVAMGARYEQDARLAHGNRPSNQDETVQSLPRLDLFLYKGRVAPELPLEIEMQANTGYMYRRSGTKGGRTEIYPRLSLPWDLKYASLIGSVGWRQTIYNTAQAANTDPLNPYRSSLPDQTGKSRSLPDADVQLYTEATRQWNFSDKKNMDLSKASLGKSTLLGLRHQVQPRVQYRMLPSVDQEDNPFYTLDDRIRSTNELTYSITNILTRKSAVVTAVPGKEDEEPSYIARETFTDLVWWKLQTGYDYKEASRNRYRDEYSRQPFMDVYSEFEVRPLDWLGYTNRSYISPYNGQLSRYDHVVSFYAWNWATVSSGLSYRSSDYEMRQKLQSDRRDEIVPESPLRLLYNRVLLTYDKTWELGFTEYRNMRTNNVYDQQVTLAYIAQCYKVITKMKSNDRERSFGIYVELPGLFE